MHTFGPIDDYQIKKCKLKHYRSLLHPQRSRNWWPI